jgi:glycosyltransferase involved in cell wall biosynthesis
LLSQKRTDVITVCIPSIPARAVAGMLGRAVLSAMSQTRRPDTVVVAVYDRVAGAAATRQRALEMVSTELVAFLDDDDEFLPHHLETLARAAADHGADMVHAQPVIVRRGSECPDIVPLSPGQITSTVLVRREVALAVGGFANIPVSYRHGAAEDGIFADRCRDAGAVIVRLPDVTWRWHHHGANVQGKPLYSQHRGYPR